MTNFENISNLSKGESSSQLDVVDSVNEHLQSTWSEENLQITAVRAVAGDVVQEIRIYVPNQTKLLSVCDDLGRKFMYLGLTCKIENGSELLLVKTR